MSVQSYIRTQPRRVLGRIWSDIFPYGTPLSCVLLVALFGVLYLVSSGVLERVFVSIRDGSSDIDTDEEEDDDDDGDDEVVEDDYR